MADNTKNDRNDNRNDHRDGRRDGRRARAQRRDGDGRFAGYRERLGDANPVALGAAALGLGAGLYALYRKYGDKAAAAIEDYRSGTDDDTTTSTGGVAGRSDAGRTAMSSPIAEEDRDAFAPATVPLRKETPAVA